MFNHWCEWDIGLKLKFNWFCPYKSRVSQNTGSLRTGKEKINEFSLRQKNPLLVLYARKKNRYCTC